jgi:restriction system protein
MSNDSKVGRKRAGELLHAALTVLRDAGGEMRGRQVMQEVEKRLKLSDYERERHEKSGYVRWESVVHFYSINAVKSGLLRKRSGVWYLTPEGEKALKLTPDELFALMRKGYRDWKRAQEESVGDEPADQAGEAAPETDVSARSIAASHAVDQAKEEIAEFIQAMNEYDFQDLVAALLRGMGYHTPFIAAKGKADGGIDVLAYSDPLGGSAPRFKVQVKHKEKPVGEKDIRDLTAVLSTPGDVGLFVSSSGFTDPAAKFARNGAKHIELVDLNRLIELWDEYYDKLGEEDKQGCRCAGCRSLPAASSAKLGHSRLRAVCASKWAGGFSYQCFGWTQVEIVPTVPGPIATFALGVSNLATWPVLPSI